MENCLIVRRKVVCRTDHEVKSQKIGGSAGCPAAVRGTFRVEADWLDIENDSGRKLLHEIPTSSAPVIGPDRENKDSHGHNRGSTSGYGPVLYRYEHSATPAPPIYSPSWRTSLYSVPLRRYDVPFSLYDSSKVEEEALGTLSDRNES